MRRIQNYLLLVLLITGQAVSQPISKPSDPAKAQARAEAVAGKSTPRLQSARCQRQGLLCCARRLRWRDDLDAARAQG